jgi:hypothetical protein
LGRRKTIHDIWLRQFVDTAEMMIKLVSMRALTTETLHLLYVIGMPNMSVLRHGGMAVIIIRRYIVITVETGMY